MLKIIILIILIVVLIFTAFLYLRNQAHMKRIEEVREMLTANTSTQGQFNPESIDTLPEVARRYLDHAIKPGTVLAQGIELHMRGSIRLNTNAAWIPFTATQTIRAGQGFVWQPDLTAKGFLKMSGADYYFQNDARLYFTIFGLIPIVNATGDEISQSAAGRFLIEGIWLPTEYLPRNGAYWQAESDSSARVIQSVDCFIATVTLQIDSTGRPLSVRTLRLQDASGKFIPFGGIIDEERQFNGYYIPSKVRVGWNFGNENFAEFFRAEIMEAHFF
jgi:hypothetical protein